MNEPDILDQADAWRAAGRGVALATVVVTWGSSPRPVGSQLAVDDAGGFVGSVSGGCIEGAVVREALDCIEDGRPAPARLRHHQRAGLGRRPRLRRQGPGLRRARRMKRATLEALRRLRAAKTPVALATDLKSGAQSLVGLDTTDGALALDPAALASVRQALRDDRGGTFDTADGPVFVNVYNPPRRLVVVGAVHIAQPLVPMAAISGFQVVVIDPRHGFATDARFPQVTLDTDWPDEAMERVKPDVRTAVVTLTHDPKLDDPALAVALRSPAFYIGALGSRRTHAARVERLKALGFGDNEIGRIDAPIGLDIGAVSPAEIAISILGKITQTLHAEPAAA
jgi:xanthine dehydrogenase accessory factor